MRLYIVIRCLTDGGKDGGPPFPGIGCPLPDVGNTLRLKRLIFGILFLLFPPPFDVSVRELSFRTMD